MAYLAGYIWLATAYAVTVGQTGSLLPGPGQWRAVWGSRWPRIALLWMVVVIDLIPPGIWAVLLRSPMVCGHWMKNLCQELGARSWGV